METMLEDGTDDAGYQENHIVAVMGYEHVSAATIPAVFVVWFRTVVVASSAVHTSDRH